ncbi:MAG: helix-turn-helix domain-containing protein [Armatimonadetes bacterium]|nr:helix-turn-helix domain-containing protein [Armatimonadota bacterium]
MSISLPVDAAQLLRCAAGYQEAGRDHQALPLLIRAAAGLAPVDPRRAAEVWRQAGRCAAAVFEHDTAIDCIRRAIALLAPPVGDEGQLAQLHGALAGICCEASRLREAEAAARQALRLAEAARDLPTAATALSTLGLAARYRGEAEEALRCFIRARRLYRLARRALPAADALYHAAQVWLDLGNLLRAEAPLHRARAEREALREYTGRIDIELARLQLRRGDVSGALGRLRRVLDSPEVRENPATHVQALTVAAEAAGQQSLRAGLDMAELALDLAQSLGRPLVLADLLPVLIRLRRLAGQPLRDGERGLLRLMAEEVEDLAKLPPVETQETEIGQSDGAPQDVHRTVPTGSGSQGNREARISTYRLVDDPLLAPTGQDIRALRLALGWTQEQLAERAGFEVTTVKRAERGARVPERTMRTLARAMGAEPTAAARTAARYWRHIGRAYEALGEFHEARSAYARAATTSSEEGDLVGEALAEVQIAHLDLQEGQDGGVVGRLLRCRKILENLGEAVACRQVDRLLAESQIIAGRAALAVPQLRRLLSVPGMSAEDRAELLDVLARAYRAAGRPADAEKVRQEAAALQVGRAQQAYERVRQYAEEAERLYRDGRKVEAAYLAEAAAQWSLVTRTLD